MSKEEELKKEIKKLETVLKENNKRWDYNIKKGFNLLDWSKDKKVLDDKMFDTINLLLLQSKSKLRGRQEREQEILKLIDERLGQIRYRIKTGFGSKEDYKEEKRILQELKQKIKEQEK